MGNIRFTKFYIEKYLKLYYSNQKKIKISEKKLFCKKKKIRFNLYKYCIARDLTRYIFYYRRFCYISPIIFLILYIIINIKKIIIFKEIF